MTLIEGVGDEVTDFFIFVVILFVGWLAWCSTSITDPPVIRTVVVLQHQSPRTLDELRAYLQNARSSNPTTSIETSERNTDDNSTNSQSRSAHSDTDTNATVSPEIRRTSEATATEEVLIATMDSFNNDNVGLLQKEAKVDESKEKSISACSDTVECEPKAISTNDDDEISIKLKFINDEQKVVTGSLKELLGDFKRRHFQIELDAQKLVRLVFKGRVLQPDSQTLEQCGLFNDCVVHCLVHQPRPSPVPPQTSTIDSSSSLYFNPQSFSDIPASTGISLTHNEWDLSRVLNSILTVMLGLAWYSRYHYAQLFTATSTLALSALTVSFTVSLFINLYPDQYNVRNIE